MIRIPWDDVISAAAPFQARTALWRAIKKQLDHHSSELCTPAHVLAAWTVAFISGPTVAAESTAALAVLDWVGGPAWEDLSTMIHKPYPYPSPGLSITANRYLALTHVLGAFDLEDEVPVNDIPLDAIETRVINLRALFASLYAKLGEWTQKPPESSPTPTRTQPAC